MLNVGLGEFHKEFHCLLLHLSAAKMVRMLASLFYRKVCIIGVVKPSCTANRKVCAWRMRNHQIPFPTLGKIIIYAIFKMASVILDHFQDILVEMPFGMSTAALQMSQL